MKLSMWILLKWFEHQGATAAITGGGRTIEGVRLFAEDADPDTNYLYVGRSTDFFPDSAPDETMLVHRYDTMAVTDPDFEAVFNSALSCFESYGELETNMLRAARGQDPEQTIVSLCEHLLGPLAVIDPFCNVLACSQRYAHRKVNKLWTEIIDGNAGVSSGVRINSSDDVMDYISNRQKLRVFTVDDGPYSNCIITSFCDSTNTLLGHLVVSSKDPITEYELQLAEVIADALAMVHFGRAEYNPSTYGVGTDEVLLVSLLSGQSDASEKQTLMNLKAWDESSRYRMVVLGISSNSDEAVLPPIHRDVKRLFPDSVSTIYQNRIVILMRLQQEASKTLLEKLINELRKHVPVLGGGSNIFRDLSSCEYALRQAEDAYASSLAHEKPFTSFLDIGASLLVKSTDDAYKQHCLHPIVPFLTSYDRINGTELAPTLREYLLAERSNAQTATRMFVHRNTVLYRIERIEKLFPVNFDNDNERLYILLSLLLGS